MYKHSRIKIDKSGNADDRRANGKHANSQRDGATCKRAVVYVAQRRFPFIKGKGLGAFIQKHNLAWHISFSPVAAMQQASLVNIGNIQTQTGRMAEEEWAEECVDVICCSTNAW